MNANTREFLANLRYLWIFLTALYALEMFASAQHVQQWLAFVVWPATWIPLFIPWRQSIRYGLAVPGLVAVAALSNPKPERLELLMYSPLLALGVVLFWELISFITEPLRRGPPTP